MTCSVVNCEAKVRARGLCSTHYNQQHQPHRHAKVQIPCSYCGTPCMKEPGTKFSVRFCDLTCRDLWRIEHNVSMPPNYSPQWTGSTVKDDLRALTSTQRWRGAIHSICLLAQARYLRRAGLALLLAPRACADCGLTFEPLTTIQRYCRGSCARRVHRRARRAAEVGALGTYTWAEVTRLWLLFDRGCAYCEQPTQRLEPDHVVPLSRGGSNSITNILPACHDCNADKRALLLDEWAADRARRGLAPRTTSWSTEDHRVRHLTTAPNRTHRAV